MTRLLGEILLEGGLVTAEQLEAAAGGQQRDPGALGRVLVEQGVLTEAQLVAALAAQIGLRFVDLTDVAIDAAAVVSVPDVVCRRSALLPIGYEDGKLLVAMADPANVFAVDDVRSITGRGAAGRGDPGRRVGGHRPLPPPGRRPGRSDDGPAHPG